MNLLDNSLVILTADYREALGNKGVFEWRNKANWYDEVIRVPLMIKPEGEKKHGGGNQVDLLDIAPTILDFPFIHKPNELAGQSLFSALNGRYKKRAVLSKSLDLRSGSAYLDEKHFGNNPKKRLILQKEGGIISYRTENWRYIHKIGGLYELYDRLKNDPHQGINPVILILI
jgi:arylsulfatase A-like enzyme